MTRPRPSAARLLGAGNYYHTKSPSLARPGRVKDPAPQTGSVPLELLIPMTLSDEIIERERPFLLPTYSRYPVALQRGPMPCGLNRHPVITRRAYDSATPQAGNATSALSTFHCKRHHHLQ